MIMLMKTWVSLLCERAWEQETTVADPENLEEWVLTQQQGVRGTQLPRC